MYASPIGPHLKKFVGATHGFRRMSSDLYKVSFRFVFFVSFGLRA